MSAEPDIAENTRPRVVARRPFASVRTIFALMLREMQTTYGRSPGGYIWAVLEPAAGIALLSLIFAAIFDSPPLGKSFPIFYATGMVPFLIYMSISGKLATALLFSRPLLAYPSVTLADAIIARLILNAMTELLVAYVIFAFLFAFFDTHTVVDLGALIAAFGMLFALSLGIGTLNCFLFSRFSAWQRIWSVLMRPMFIISGIFFVYSTIPQPYREVVWYNPLIHIVGAVRHGFYPTYDASYVSPLYILSVSLICFVAGFVLLSRYYRDLLIR